MTSSVPDDRPVRGPLADKGQLLDILAPLLRDLPPGTAQSALDNPNDTAVAELLSLDPATLAGDPTATASAFVAAMAAIRSHPNAAIPQITALFLMEALAPGTDLTESWAALAARFPENDDVVRMRLGALGRNGRMAEGAELIRNFATPMPGENPTEAMARQMKEAERFCDLGDTLSASMRFETLVDRYPGEAGPAIAYAKHLSTTGALWEAGRVLASIRDASTLTAADWDICNQIADALRRAGQPEEVRTGLLAKGLEAMQGAMSRFTDRASGPTDPAFVDGVQVFVDTLQGGQIDRTGLHFTAALAEMNRNRQSAGRYRIGGPIGAIVIDTQDPPDGLIDTPQASAKGVILRRLSELDIAPLPERFARDTDFLKLLENLPLPARLGLERLTPVLANNPPEVVVFRSIDSLVAGALAALVAGIPAIVFRPPAGLDPTPGVQAMLRDFLALPGVSLALPEGGLAATGLPADITKAATPPIWPDLAERVNAAGTPACRQLWEQFVRRTSECRLTVGSILDPGAEIAQAETWLDLLDTTREAGADYRFVLLASDRTLTWIKEHLAARELGDTCLLIARDDDLGFWLKRLDSVVFFGGRGPLSAGLRAAQLAGRATILIALDRTVPVTAEGVDIIPPDPNGRPNLPVCLDWLELQRSNPSLRQALARRSQREAVRLCSPGATVETFAKCVKSNASRKTDSPSDGETLAERRRA